MTVNLSLEGDPDGLPLLAEWLKEDETLDRPRLSIISQPPSRDQMGTLVDIIAITLGPSSSLPALAGSLATWLVSRKKRCKITIGKSTVSVSGSEDVDNLTLKVLDKLSNNNAAH